MTIAAVILAGGRAERLGGALKSELVVGGQRLLDRVANRLTGCDPVFVAHGRTDPALFNLRANLIPIPDLPIDYAGPLAGFTAAVTYCARMRHPPDLLVTAAVDAPFLPADYITRLVQALGSADAAVASYAGQTYPTNAVWRVARFADLPAQAIAGTAPHSLKRLAIATSALDVAWPETAAGDPFANINTPDELEAMQRRLHDTGGLSH